MIMDLIRRHRFESLARIILISSLFMIDDGASSERLPSTVNDCSPNPCQNQALCRSRGGGYSCFCVPGFQGTHCQIDVNECLSQPCKNGATCVDRVGRYTCDCAPGFTGHTCGLQIDECQSQPCLNGGSCHDNTNGFTCTCQPGFQGDRCENDIDECQAQPCQNGAQCIDGVNQYSCDCSYTAFIGQHCETLASLCLSQPCLNSAPCQDNDGNYTCECWPGFEGRQCEVDINECGSGPCMHGGRCMERSWRVLYGREPQLPAVYDHQHAAGFICGCPPETTGSFCQEVIDQCDSRPCQNGGMCESRAGGYVCHCLQQSQDGVLHSGVNCDLELVGCEGHECQNEGSCSPFLTDGTHGYTCSCSPGFTGPLCETSTAFSFEHSGYLLLQVPMVESDASCNITLSFRTVLTRALLFQRTSRGQLLGLELEAGQLRLSLRRETSTRAETETPSQVLELPHNVTDGEWHSVEAVLGKWLLSLRLKDDSGACENQDCQRVAPINTALAGLASPLKSTFIGGVPEHTNGHTEDIELPAFIGCMQDVFVDSQLVVPAEWLSDSAVNVSPGCSHRDRCLDVPCQNRGQCINLWQNYQCRCPRPYEGQDCADEYVTGRFWSEDSPSYAVFNVTDDQGHDLTISFFVRTRRQTGLLLALANSDRHYLGIWLEDGRVRVQVNNLESLKGERMINDGDSHFVSVEVAWYGMALYVAAQKQGYVGVTPVNVKTGDMVYVGGLPEQMETSAFGGHFKGCIQDLRINDRRLQFFGLMDTSVRSFPLEHMANVTAGCSGDNVCKRNPCLNGGMCYSMWDDFSCTCPSSTSGRRCEEVRWCELSPCPADAKCKMLNQGYECYSNATFLDNSSVLTYRGNGRIAHNLTSLSLSLRTRKCHAAILHAEQASAFITVSIQDGLLFMELQNAGEEDTSGDDEGAERLSAVSLSSRRSVCDGEWHGVHFFMAAPWAHASRWTLVLDEDVEEASTSASQAGNLDFLGQGVDIFLGGLGPEAGWMLAGCLGTVEIGGVALPYYSSSEVNFPRAQREQFVRVSPLPPQSGCSGGAVCWPDSPCLNGGECQDLFNVYNCSCAEGWAGRHCDFFTDTCALRPCVHGNCSVRGTSYECACEIGYAGVDCEVEVDVCERHECAHGGTCLHGPDKYACLCPENYTGPLCKERVEEIPWFLVHVVRTIKRHKLPVSVCGDDTRNYTCFNGGNCTDLELSCDCPPGFTGHRCEQEVDECKSNPCLNGGYCRNLINKFVCVCDMSFAGEVCQTDVSDIYFYVAVLLWQNLFQLLSYLIIRLDDLEPQIDWGVDDE